MNDTNIADLRTKLVTVVRLMAMEGLIDFNGHVSCRLPDTDHVLINSRYSSRFGLTVDDIVTVDLAGQLLEGKAEPPSETAIHTEIYKARPDVGSVAHLHPQYATVFTIAGKPLVPVFIIASLFGPEGVPVFDDPRLIWSEEEGAAVAAVLGDRPAVLLRSHGAVTVGPDIEGTFAVAVALEDNARKYLWASALGTPRPLSVTEMEQYGAPVSTRGTRHKVWDFYVAKGHNAGLL